MTKATISPGGQIAIPKDMLDRLDLKPGAEISIDVNGESIIMKRAPSNYPDWRSMEGMAQGGESLTEALMEERAAEVRHDNARIQGR